MPIDATVPKGARHLIAWSITAEGVSVSDNLPYGECYAPRVTPDASTA